MDTYAWIRKDLEDALQNDGPIDTNAPMPQFWIKHMEEAMENYSNRYHLISKNPPSDATP